MDTFSTIDEYIAQFPPEIQARLNTIRNLVHEVSPEAVEVISYQMPAFKYKKKILVYFAAFKNHIGFYATPEVNTIFKDVLSAYKVGKGSIQFQNKDELPLDLIRKLTVYKMNSIDLKIDLKSK